MSLHASNPETEARLHKQRVRSSVASFLIGGLVLALLMIIMALILLVPLLKETPTIVTYQGATSLDEQINTVAMMEPKAEAAMKDLAKRTGGQFTIVQKGGKVKLVPLK